MGPLGACGWDEHVRLGCAAAECPCSWLERCMPRYELVRQHSSYELVNVGVCATSHLQPLFATVLLAVLLLLGTLLAKWSLRIWEASTKKSLTVSAADVNALCAKDLGVDVHRVWLHQTDFSHAGPPPLGSELEFFLYRDAKGIGAADALLVKAKEEEAPLPSGWKKVWCEQHKEWYYWNSARKEAQWVRPIEVSEAPLPKGWEKVFDVQRGQHYYWHAALKKSTWERPEASARMQGKVVEWNGVFGWLQGDGHSEKILLKWRDVCGETDLTKGDHVEFLLSDDGGPRALEVCSVSAPKRKKPPTLEKADDAVEGQKEKKPKKDELNAERAPELDHEEKLAPLLPGWEEHFSEDYEQPYYWHQQSKQSSWDRPSVAKDQGDEPEVTGKPLPAAFVQNSHARPPIVTVHTRSFPRPPPWAWPAPMQRPVVLRPRALAPWHAPLRGAPPRPSGRPWR